MKKRNIIAFIIYLTLLLIPQLVLANNEPIDNIPSKARCSVCGMFVEIYPNWIAQIHYDTLTQTKFFDGVKDMMVFYFDPEHYGGQPRETIKNMFVKDYYSLRWLSAKDALYVFGSDIYGPMGHELIPFETRDAAESFSKDHHGKNILTFDEITPDLIESMRAGQRMR